MPTIIDQKIVDPESELNNVKRLFTQLAPKCSVERQARGELQLVLPQKQLAMLTKELEECEIVMRMARSGENAQHDVSVKQECLKSLREYEKMGVRLRDEKAQQFELDLLNYLSQKKIQEIGQQIPSPIEEHNMIERHQHNLRRLNNRLELATKRFCAVRCDNMKLRQEIQMLLVERENFNVQWNRTISKLMRGKMYLMDILEIANQLFDDREKLCGKLEALKWKGLFQLNRDIAEMQTWQCELSHATEIEQFLRIKGTNRVLEAEAKDEMKRELETRKCEEDIKKYDDLLDEVFKYMGEERVGMIINRFHVSEIENFSVFILVCEVMQETVNLRRELERIRQTILDQHDMNAAKIEYQEKNISELKVTLKSLREKNAARAEVNLKIETILQKVIAGIEEIVKLGNCDRNPMLSLLGNNTEVSRWNVGRYLRILEEEIQARIAIEVVKPTLPPRVTSSKMLSASSKISKMSMVDPNKPILQTPSARALKELCYERLVPTPIQSLVPYHPCAYCVEDYIMHLVFEAPVQPADQTYIDEIFHLEDINTDIGIFTLTVPEKRHPFRGGGADKNTFV